jgi:hypothetical protein
MKTLAALMICAGVCLAQQVYTIPYNSKGNTIELAIANTANISADQVKVELTDAPKDMEFVSKSVTIPKVNANEEQTASFTFNAGKTSEVNKERALKFTVTGKNGQTWSKEIKFKIAPPETYELFQNYPNPFNPSTMISYQLPMDCRVNLRIYDMIGRDVITLANEQQTAGGHEFTLDASRFASGIYIYQLTAIDPLNNRHAFQKKMVLLR